MKTKTNLLLTALACSSILFTQAQTAVKNDPAYLPIDEAIDFSEIRPEVNVNLPQFLIRNAFAEFDGSDGDPLAATGINMRELLEQVKLIRVVVIEADAKSAGRISDAAKKLRHELDNNWISIVTVPEDNVGIYAKSDKTGKEMAGLALLINDDSDMVVGNIVGNIPLGKVLKIAQSVGKGKGVDLEAILGQFQMADHAESKLEKAEK